MYRCVNALIQSIFLYACESWTLTAELQRKIQAVEIRCFRRILGISYTDHITNEEVRRTISRHVKHYEDLLKTVKKRKLKWYRHVTRSSTLSKTMRIPSKTILQGTVQGKRIWERQRKTWADNIADWTGKTFAKTQALAHDGKKWSPRQVVHRSSMQCPYDPGG